MTKFGELRTSLEVRRSAGLEAAREVVLDDRGRMTMDALRDTIAAMQQTELTLLADRTATSHATERRLLQTTIVCTTISLVARIGLALAMRRVKR